MGKLVFRLVLIAAVVLALAFVAVQAAGHVVLAGALENAIGAPVSVDKLHVGILSQEIGIYGLRIKNPKGFTEPTLASVPEIFVRMDLGSVFQKTAHIKEIRLNLDQITVEKNAAGEVNVNQLGAVKGKSTRTQTNERADSQTSTAKQEKEAEPIHVKIDRVDLTLGRARYVDSSGAEPAVRDFSLDIKHAILTDLTDPRQITQQIILKTVQKITLNALGPDLNALQASLDVQLGDKIDEAKKAFGAFAEKFNLPLSESVSEPKQ